tara:strand:+ start:489 stop:716 length:228 start_codon:yes stop_codon:yes gene_type:complete
MKALAKASVLALATATFTMSAPSSAQSLRCPSGYYKSGSFCKAFGPNSKPAVACPGSSCRCPSGWYKSGDFCLSF